MKSEQKSKLKIFLERFFVDKKIVISSENSLKTINIPRNYQIVLTSIVGVFLLIFIVFFIFGLNLYGKVDKKQRKIDQMNQDSEYAKTEIKNMINYIDEVSAYFTKVKKLSTPPKNVSKANLLESEDGDNEKEIEIDAQNNKTGQNKIDIKEDLLENKNTNPQANPSQINITPEATLENKDDLRYLIENLTFKIDRWREMLVQRYYYIYSILEKLNIADCKDISWFSKTLLKAEDAIERISSSGQATNSTIKRLKNKICANGSIQAISKSYSKLTQKNIKNDIDFIKNLTSLEEMIMKIPLGIPIKERLRLSSPFGYRKDPIRGGRAFHAGQDVVARYGAPIFSPAYGVVTKAGWFSGYGWCVDIQHDFGISTRYGHLSAINVHLGQRVYPNSLIGKEGSSGKSTGPHLHYEIRINNLAINPKGFMFVNR